MPPERPQVPQIAQDELLAAVGHLARRVRSVQHRVAQGMSADRLIESGQARA